MISKLKAGIFIGGIVLCGFVDAGSSSQDAFDVDNIAESLEVPSDDLLHEKCEEESGIIIPDNIKKDVPTEMQYHVFLQLILGLVKGEYVKELSDPQITEKTISGLLASLDPHSSYLNEKNFRALRNHSDGEFGGLGIEIIMDEGFIRIMSPIDDTPAYKAGLKSGDLIIYIDGECVNGLSAEEALEKLRGKPGTCVKLKIKRGDKPPFDVEITRAIIKIQSVKTEILDNIAYVRISTFDKNTSKSLKQFIKENRSKKLRGMVLDLRNNPGGLLDESVAVANMFLKGGKIVATRGRTQENTRCFRADNVDITDGLPLVVLINNGTASAPEIVAGALRDNKRAIIVGTRSFGKGSVQKIIPLSEKTAIRLTVAKHYTPSGECIQANGIKPDIEADYALVKKLNHAFVVREEFFVNALDADKHAKNKKFSDEENRKALDALSKQDKKDKQEIDEDDEISYRSLSLKERVVKDYQLGKAFDVVKIMEKLRHEN